MSILQKNKKVAAGIGVTALAAATIALGTGTYAAFQDTEVGPGGTLAAGTLDLVVGGTGTETLFSATNVQPGQAVPQKTLTITNSGSVNGSLSGIVTIDGSDTSCTEPEQAEVGNACSPNGNLQDQLIVTVKGEGLPTQGVTVPLPELTSFPLPGALPLDAGATATYTFDFLLPHLPGTANNKVQSDSLTISTTLNLTQAPTP
ncbi:TasA family protein [Pseudonocardia bannensis]|uniref:Camelysin-like metallo-endopeptidase n=1 Tax=Pseudonocardia bannensis TaxID=630973 RepID=A0A848DJT4_9PSEU|nr:TasA family protein [Pseudonocardia bannensis]NMH92980.1 hypothetical protein [Pseudonocardia bannensis]